MRFIEDWKSVITEKKYQKIRRAIVLKRLKAEIKATDWSKFPRFETVEAFMTYLDDLVQRSLFACHPQAD